MFVKEVKCAKMGFKKSSQDYRCGVLNKASPLESQWLKKLHKITLMKKANSY
jgi:hypothetical protein